LVQRHLRHKVRYVFRSPTIMTANKMTLEDGKLVWPKIGLHSDNEKNSCFIYLLLDSTMVIKSLSNLNYKLLVLPTASLYCDRILSSLPRHVLIGKVKRKALLFHVALWHFELVP
jgi:hypothetical protein